MTDSPNIAIVGAGVVGLTVARLLQSEQRHCNLTIIADAFKEDTTSAVAAGIFRPGTSFKGSTDGHTKKWIRDSWHYWQEILKSPEASQAGLMTFSAYIFSKKHYSVTRNHLIEDLVPIYRAVDDNELSLCGDGWKYGSYFSTVKIGCDRYLPWAEGKFIQDGGKILTGRVDNIASLRGKYDLVFNCTGFGAKALCNDHDLVPIRGQVLKVRAPWLKTAFYGDYDTYVIPGFDGVATLGGVRQYDSYNTDVCRHDSAAILERCCAMLPALKSAEVVAHRVGLRPHRVPVRVEPEVLDGVKVVHCYGHGGYGVTCAPGTAIDAVSIGVDLFKCNMRNKL
ncbi:unnamed protein product, partial [Iphiclides podalirius]